MPRPSNLRRRPVPSNLPSEETGSEIFFWMSYATPLDSEFNNILRNAIFAYDGRNWRLVVDNPISNPESPEETGSFNVNRCIYEGGYHWINNVQDQQGRRSGAWRSIDAVTWELSLGFGVIWDGDQEFQPNIAEVRLAADGSFFGILGDGGSGDNFGPRIYRGTGAPDEWELISFLIFDQSENTITGNFPSFTPNNGMLPHPNNKDTIVWEDFDQDPDLDFFFQSFIIVTRDSAQSFAFYETFPGTWAGFNKTGESAGGYVPSFPFRYTDNGTLIWLKLTKEIDDEIARIQIYRTNTPEDSASWEFATLAEVNNFGRSGAATITLTPQGKRIFATAGDTAFPEGTPAYRYLFVFNGGNDWSEIELDSILGPLTGDRTLDVHLDAIWYDEPTDTLYIASDGSPDGGSAALIFKCSGSSLGNWQNITPDWSRFLEIEDGSMFIWGRQTVWGGPGAAPQGNVNRPPST